MYFADQALFIMIATLLWAADIDAKSDPQGNPMKPSAEERIDKGIVMFASFN